MIAVKEVDFMVVTDSTVKGSVFLYLLGINTKFQYFIIIISLKIISKLVFSGSFKLCKLHKNRK
jgi:hypothetical protein